MTILLLLDGPCQLHKAQTAGSQPSRKVAMMAQDTTQYNESMGMEPMVKAMGRLEHINTPLRRVIKSRKVAFIDIFLKKKRREGSLW